MNLINNLINKLTYKIKRNSFDNIEDINQIEFNLKQKEQIFLGEKKGLDVSLYATPDFEWMQMLQINLGLEKGLDVTPYLNPGIDWKEMERIRLELENNE